MTEYYGYGFPNKRRYSMKSILLHYDNKDGFAREHLLKDISTKMNIKTPIEWNNTPGLNLINLDLNLYF